MLSSKISLCPELVVYVSLEPAAVSLELFYLSPMISLCQELVVSVTASVESSVVSVESVDVSVDLIVITADSAAASVESAAASVKSAAVSVDSTALCVDLAVVSVDLLAAVAMDRRLSKKSHELYLQSIPILKLTTDINNPVLSYILYCPFGPYLTCKECID
jgi:hypothetical protein